MFCDSNLINKIIIDKFLHAALRAVCPTLMDLTIFTEAESLIIVKFRTVHNPSDYS